MASVVAAWPTVALGEVLISVSRPVRVDAAQMYSLLGMRWYAGGLYIKERKLGAQIQADTLYEVRQGDFVYNRLFAWKGSFGIADGAVDGCFVSNEFPCFHVDEARTHPGFLRWYFTQANVWDFVQGQSSGSTPTSRLRLKEPQFLALQIPLPPLDEQRRIVARIEALAARIAEARGLRREAMAEAETLMDAVRASCFSPDATAVEVGDVVTVIDPNPSHRYPIYSENGVPMVSSSEFVGEDGIDWSRAKRVPESFFHDTLGRFGVGGGDIIFSRKGKVGYARLHPHDVKLAMTHTLCVIQPDRTRLDERYLLHFARSRPFLDYLEGTMNPNLGVPTLGLGVIRSACLPVPHIAEQQEVAKRLDDVQKHVDALTQFQQETQSELDALLPSVLDKAFRGEL